MIDSVEDFELALKRLLSKYKVRYRRLSIDDNTVTIGIEGTKYDYPKLNSKLSLLRLQPVNCSYGRWVYRIR